MLASAGTVCKSHSRSNARPKEALLIEFTKQNLVKTAVLGSAIIGVVMLAVPASAASPGPSNYRADDHVAVSYNDATNQFCASMETVAGGVLPALKMPFDPEIRVVPEGADSGPARIFNINPGETKCVSLEGAVEDSRYYYQVGSRAPGILLQLIAEIDIS